MRSCHESRCRLDNLTLNVEKLRRRVVLVQSGTTGGGVTQLHQNRGADRGPQARGPQRGSRAGVAKGQPGWGGGLTRSVRTFPKRYGWAMRVVCAATSCQRPFIFTNAKVPRA